MFGDISVKREIFRRKKPKIALTSHNIDFFLPVKPKQRVNVVSEKIYFRFNKLKCKVELFNEKNQLVCKGYISGMLKINDKNRVVITGMGVVAPNAIGLKNF